MNSSQKLAIASLLSLGLLVSATQSASATPRTNVKVTICHRTHSVTNPYRMITVSMNSVNGPLNTRTGNPTTSATVGDHAGYVHNKFAKTGSHARVYPSNPHVFSSTFSYSGANKVWEDIIPPFTQTKNGSTATYNGFNWSVEGKAIYFGTGSSHGACKKMTAKEFYDSEVAAGQTPKDVLDDIKEQEAEEDGGLKPNSVNDLPNEPSHPNGPTPPSNIGSQSQKLLGRVWYDDNHDGTDTGENGAPSVTVELVDPDGNVAGTTATDANGNYEIPSVAEGKWKVRYVLPTGYSYTYDSTDASDGDTSAIVPAGGAGYSWAGLILTSAGFSPPTFTVATPAPSSSSSSASNSSSTSSAATTAALANTGQSIPVIVPILGFAVVLIGGLALFFSRRRSVKR